MDNQFQMDESANLKLGISENISEIILMFSQILMFLLIVERMGIVDHDCFIFTFRQKYF